MKKIQAGVIGASGYAGAELVRLLWNHPMVEVSGISSKSYTGQKISDLYPGFYQICDMVFQDEDSVIRKVFMDCLNYSEMISKEKKSLGIQAVIQQVWHLA